MKESHHNCLQAALAEAASSAKSLVNKDDFFIATIDGEPFEAQEVHGFYSFGVRIVVGLINEGRSRRYITFAADDDLCPGTHIIGLEEKVTVGYIDEGKATGDYPSDLGNAEIHSVQGDTFSGRFIANLVQGSDYSAITRASFRVSTLRNLSQA